MKCFLSSYWVTARTVPPESQSRDETPAASSVDMVRRGRRSAVLGQLGSAPALPHGRAQTLNLSVRLSCNCPSVIAGRRRSRPRAVETAAEMRAHPVWRPRPGTEQGRRAGTPAPPPTPPRTPGKSFLRANPGASLCSVRARDPEDRLHSLQRLRGPGGGGGGGSVGGPRWEHFLRPSPARTALSVPSSPPLTLAPSLRSPQSPLQLLAGRQHCPAWLPSARPPPSPWGAAGPGPAAVAPGWGVGELFAAHPLASPAFCPLVPPDGLHPNIETGELGLLRAPGYF